MSTEITNFFDSEYDTPILTTEQEQNNGVSQAMNDNADSTNSVDKKKETKRDKFAKHSVSYKKKKIERPEKVGIFFKKYVNILAGRSGVGKTWQIVRWLRDLSVGGEIFGGIAHNEPPRKCLLLAGETLKDENELRCRDIEKGDGIERNDDNFIIMDMQDMENDGLELMLNTAQGQENITELIEYHSPDIVVFDSFVSFNKGDESKSTDIQCVMSFLAKLAKKYDTAPVLIHHSRKRLPREQTMPLDLDDIIGSNVFARKSGLILIAEQSIIDKTTINVKVVKSWFKTTTNSFSYTIKDGFYGGIVMDINPNADNRETTIKNNSPVSQAENYRQRITDILKARETHKATTKELREIIGVDKDNESSFNTHLARMCANGEIIRAERGTYSLPQTALNQNNSPE